jgi:hypothetical protein
MDNASFHHSDGVQELCLRAGVKLVFLPPNSPDLDPIEEFFGDLKQLYRVRKAHDEASTAATASFREAKELLHITTLVNGSPHRDLKIRDISMSSNPIKTINSLLYSLNLDLYFVYRKYLAS